MLLSIVLIIVLAYIGFGLYLYLNQEKYLFFPTGALEVDFAEQINIEHDGVTLRITVLNPGQDKGILYFGGNAEPVESNSGQYGAMFPQKTVYLLSYRGYGHSTGEPSEAAFYKDAEFVFDQLKDLHSNIAVIGRSLGTGVATWLASVRELEKLVLVTPYDSITAVAQDNYPFYPVNLILKHKFDSLSRASDIDEPTLILIAEKDGLIPPSHSYKLAQAFRPSVVETKLINHANHNDITTSTQYVEAMIDFLK